MTFSQLRLLLVIAAFSLLGAGTASAQPMSLMNPYRSFNLSGINYGSQQWEKDQARYRAQQTMPVVQQYHQPVRIFHERRRRFR